MGGKWSIEARDYADRTWKLIDYSSNGFIILCKAVYCFCKYDVVYVSKHYGNFKGE